MDDSEDKITIAYDTFFNESEMRQLISMISTRLVGSASNINGYSKDFIRETWDIVDWMDIFSWWYQRSLSKSNKLTFNNFMQMIDPDKEFYKAK